MLRTLVGLSLLVTAGWALAVAPPPPVADVASWGPPVVAGPDGAGPPRDPAIVESTRRPATVTGVVDGDTLGVRYPDGSGDVVRLVGVDAPETHGDPNPGEFPGVPASDAGRTCLGVAGERATLALRALVGSNASVSVAGDPDRGSRDRFGRRLAYVGRDGWTVNYRLVAAGHARVFDRGFSLAGPYRAAEEAAREDRRGLWDCVGQE